MATTFSFDAGNLALDLLNTDGRFGGGGHDDLQSPAALLAWLTAAAVLPERERARLLASPPEASVLLTEAQRLRHEVGAAVGAMSQGRPATEGTLMTLNRLLRRRTTTLRLAREADDLVVVKEEAGDSPMAVLAPLAEAAARLLAEGDPGRIRQCHAGDCRCWFVDTSKNGRRKWCSMARCGNRAKVAAHYRRRQRD